LARGEVELDGVVGEEDDDEAVDETVEDDKRLRVGIAGFEDGVEREGEDNGGSGLDGGIGVVGGAVEEGVVEIGSEDVAGCDGGIEVECAERESTQLELR
jgi:hypothetical protein